MVEIGWSHVWYRWSSTARIITDGIRENLTKYVTSFSSEIADIFDKFKIFDVIKDLDDNDLLFLVVERFCNPRIDLSPASVSNADMGDIYEELIRRFSEASNESAGEHFSPRDGLRLAAELLVVGEKAKASERQW